MNLATIVSAARKRECQISLLEEKLADLKRRYGRLKGRLVIEADKEAVTDAKGTKRGELVTDSGTVKVTWPVASLALTPLNFAGVRKIAGNMFGKLAIKVPVSHKLISSARDLIPALLTPKKAAKLLQLLGGEASAPRLSFS